MSFMNFKSRLLFRSVDLHATRISERGYDRTISHGTSLTPILTSFFGGTSLREPSRAEAAIKRWQEKHEVLSSDAYVSREERRAEKGAPLQRFSEVPQQRITKFIVRNIVRMVADANGARLSTAEWISLRGTIGFSKVYLT
jgi:hypothetical protein